MTISISDSDFYDDYIRVRNVPAGIGGTLYVKKDGGLEELKAAIEKYETEQEEKRNKPDFKPGDIVRLTGEHWKKGYPELVGTLHVITGKNGDGYPTFTINEEGTTVFVGFAYGYDWSAELVGRVTESEDN